ncbi:hypothetical protein, partial [Candidatus Dormiibacter inghamiae]|uniref:hypothetical protein n=1 Tax=Candidatus Dormiibacter inghamiae TaxID=3127013 RepID=UPI0030C77002
EQPVRFAELADNLLRGVLSAFHFGSSLPSRAVLEPSYQMDQFSGVRSVSVRLRARRGRRRDGLDKYSNIWSPSSGRRWPRRD